MKTYTKDDYSLRPFFPDDWEAYKAIRLESLKNEPGMFGSNFAKEEQYTEVDWRSPHEDHSRRKMFGLYYKDKVVGVTGAALVKEDHTKTVLVAFYIQNEHRGKKLSSLFYDAGLEWAREQNCQSIIITHRADNEPSNKATQRFGFKHTHSNSHEWPDGKKLDQLYYSFEI